MFRPFALAAALATLLALPLQAQDDALRAAAERYIQNPVQQGMLDDMLSADAFITQMRAVLPDMTEDQLVIVGQIGAEEMGAVRSDLEAAMVDAAVATFTLDEIEALEAFYSTPLGASVMSKMQPFMDVAMQSAAPAMQSMQLRISERVMQELMR